MRRGLLLLIPPFFFLTVFFFLPLISMLMLGMEAGGEDAVLPSIWSFFSSPYYLRVLGFSLFQAVLSTGFALLLGIPGAYIISHYRFPGKEVVKALSIIPFILPSILVVLGFVLFFGNNGYINRLLMMISGADKPPIKILYSLGAIILAHGFYNFPICIRVVSAAWERVSLSKREAASGLGAKGFRLFTSITLPDILPALLSAAVLIFLFCFLSFAIILVLGGGPRYTTVEVEIYRLARMNVDFRSASILAIVQTMISLVVMYGYIRLQAKSSISTERSQAVKVRPARELFKGLRALPVSLYLVLIVLLVLGPLTAVFIQSFLKPTTWAAPPSLSIEWYKDIFQAGRRGISSPLLGIKNSLIFGLSSAGLSLVIGTILARVFSRNRSRLSDSLESVAMLPMGISPVVIGLSYILLSRSAVKVNGMILIILAHSLISYPFVLRTMSAAFGNLGRSTEEAALSLGATPVKVFCTIDLPLLKGTLLSAASFAFAISIGEINATIMLADQDMVTIPIVMYRLIASYKFYAACALGTVLMLVTGLVFLLIDRLGGEQQ